MSHWPLDHQYPFNGHRIRYAVHGDGPPLEFVHGTPFSSYVWHRIAQLYFATPKVHYFDPLGYGQPAHPDADAYIGVKTQSTTPMPEHWGWRSKEGTVGI